jgi:hypothetical protein
MQETLRILVVGSDAEHDISEVANGYKGWTPQIMRMTEPEWQLSDLDSCANKMSAMRHGALHNAERALLEQAFYPVSTDSRYYFCLHQAYTRLYSNTNTGSIAQIVARSIIGDYLHDAEKSPLVAAVLTEPAWDWYEANDVWISQLPPEATIWVMRSNGKLEIVRCEGTTDVNI